MRPAPGACKAFDDGPQAIAVEKIAVSIYTSMLTEAACWPLPLIFAIKEWFTG